MTKKNPMTLQSLGIVTKKVNTLSRRMKSVQKAVETKYHSRSETITGIEDDAWTTKDLSLIPQEDTAKGRDGVEVQPQYLTIRYTAQSVNSSGFTQFRLVLSQYNGPDSTIPTDAYPALASDKLNTISNWTKERKRYHKRILYDKVINLSPTTIVGAVKTGVIRIKLFKRPKIRFDGSGVSNTVDGGLVMAFTSSAPNAGALGVTFYYDSQLAFQG